LQGLALEGGGAKGAYQIGAYKALTKNGYRFKAIAGTSIGSVNAALICQGDFALLERLWKELDATVFNMEPNVVHSIVTRSIAKDDIKSTFNKVKEILKNKGIDTTTFKKFLNHYIDEEKVRKSKIKFGLVTVRLSDFKPLELTIDDIPKGKLTDYIMASCYLPVFNMNKIIDDHYYLDGGFTNVLPITLLERMGCNDIIGVRVKKFGLIKKKRKKETKVTIISPKKNIGSVLLLDKDRSKENMKRGYIDTLKVLGKLEGKKFSFKRKSRYYYDFIHRNFSKMEIEKLCKKWHVKNKRELTLYCLEMFLSKAKSKDLEIYDVNRLIRKLKKEMKNFKKDEFYHYLNRIKNY